MNLNTSNAPSFQKVLDGELQSDGKIIYVGGIYRIDNPYVHSYGFIARNNVDGTKDNSFNNTGFITVCSGQLQAVTIQNDNKIVAVGGNGIHRFLSNGDVDTSFNLKGSLNIILNHQVMEINDVNIQNDNKIVVSGYIPTNTDFDFAVVRINTDGTLDSTFDGDGILLISNDFRNDYAFSNKIMDDGKILIAGYSKAGTKSDFALAKINSDGTLDSTFGTNGKVISTISTGNDLIRNIEIQSDGKVLVFGSTSLKFTMVRYTSDGVLDTTFDTDGILILNHNMGIGNPRLKILLNGKMILAGTSDNDYKVIQLLADGSYDSTFDSDGVLIVNENKDSLNFLIEKPDGKLITGGYSYDVSLNDYTIKEFELDADGAILSNNTKKLYLSYETNLGASIELNDQSILTLSSDFINNQASIVIKKILANGEQDMSFGISGRVDIPYGTTSGLSKAIQLSDNKILVSTYSASLIRLNPDGQLDSTFGTGGVLNIRNLSNALGVIDDFIISNDNKILLAVDYYDSNDGSDNTGVLKLNMNGTIDNSFGTNGIVMYKFNEDDNYYEYPVSIIQDFSDKIVLTSLSSNRSEANNSDINVSKLNFDGTFDNTFGTNGKVTHICNEPISQYGIINTSENGYIINYSSYGGLIKNGYSHTMKLNNDGTINTNFGNNGIAEDFAGSSNTSAMILQTDDKILKAGIKNNQFSISRYNPDGSIDITFGNSGEISTPISIESKIDNILIQSDGKLLATGYSFDGDRQVITLARYGGLTLGTIDFAIAKNNILVYPNPIELEATFEYSLNQNTTVSIAIVDLEGRIVKTIATNQEKAAGKQLLNISLDSDMSSGNYFIKISSPQGTQSVQIIKK